MLKCWREDIAILNLEDKTFEHCI